MSFTFCPFHFFVHSPPHSTGRGRREWAAGWS